MIIEIKKFKLVSNDDKFDLIEKAMVEKTDKVTRKKTGETVEKEKVIGYSMRLPDIIKYILDRTVNDQKLTIDLSTYVTEYKKQREIITNLLK
jgi:hypothetical protein